MLKIRLRRMGAKFQPHYRVVVADSRAPRDGRFVTILGYYDPRTEPATIHVDAAKIEEWVRRGAQPTLAVIGLLHQAKLAPEVIATFNRKNHRKTRESVAAAAVAQAAAAETADQA
ncbi:MAG TPA: 30S ribosomal protein S16 [Chloroflexia bacterium]|nr:30S ribosomal protein S16 [Chloroflexia bacterium]